MIISIITLFPEMFEYVFNTSILKRAQEEGKLTIHTINLRDFGIGRHRTVDDKPYGGGVGMVLRVDVIDKAIQFARAKKDREKVILLDPKGKVFTQGYAETLSKLKQLILICGHYEGYDERVRKLVDAEISIGDFVLSGGEIPAMVVVDSVARLIPGVLRKDEATRFESFSKIRGRRVLEYPQYTRPHMYKTLASNTRKLVSSNKTMVVPKVLLSGDRSKIEEFRLKKSMQITKKRRPDILKT